MPKDIDRIEQRDRLRDEPLPHDTIIVVRGGPDTVTKILGHACRTQQRWALDGKPLLGRSRNNRHHLSNARRAGDEST